MTSPYFSLILLVILVTLSTNVLGQQTVEVSTGIHSKQASGQQQGFGYRYQFNDALAIKTQYFYADRIEVQQDQQIDWVDYQHWLVGAEFLHQQAGWQLSIGGGVDIVSQSSQSAVIEESQLAPYVSFGASYPLSSRWSVSVSQFFHFNSDGLGNYQSLQLGVQYHFGEPSNNRPIRPNKQPQQLISSQSTAPSNIEVDVTSKQIEPTSVASLPTAMPEACWLIQWGVFASQDNAAALRNRISQWTVNVSLLQKNNNTRVVSPCFASKQAAETKNLSLLKQFKLQGFVRERP